MRYLASERLEVIRIVAGAHLPAKRTFDQLGMTRRIFYRWYDRVVLAPIVQHAISLIVQ